MTYSPSSYRQGSTFGRFSLDYPVLLSTCHSLRDSVADGFLLDVLVIDESSQVGLLEAGLALSCCRNLVVVGDLRQLPQFGKYLVGRHAVARQRFDHDHDASPGSGAGV